MILKLSNFGLCFTIPQSVCLLHALKVWSFNNQHWMKLFWSKPWKGCRRWDWWYCEACCLLFWLQTELPSNPQSSFAEYANEILPKITVQYVENESMELWYQLECWEKAKKKQKGTLKVYCVKRFMQNSSWGIKIHFLWPQNLTILWLKSSTK